jgi:hypothetical protein
MDRGLNRQNPTYDKGYIMRRITHTWPDAKQFERDPHHELWNEMDRFERLCWAWSKLNTHAIQAVHKDPNCKLIKFEDIFISEAGVSFLIDALHFVGEIHDIDPVRRNDIKPLLNIQPNVSRNKFPYWNEWSEKRKKFFLDTCMPLMEKLDYPVK